MALGAQALLAAPSLLFDPSFGTRLGSFLAGPEQVDPVEPLPQAETLTETLLRRQRLRRLMEAQGPLTPTASASATLGQDETSFAPIGGSRDVQGSQGPQGAQGTNFGGRRLRLDDLGI